MKKEYKTLDVVEIEFVAKDIMDSPLSASFPEDNESNYPWE
jgi:hypothetical protein